MNVEIQIWTLIGVVIAGGGIAISLILHAMGFLGERIDALDTKVDAVDTKVDALDAKVDALDAKIDTKVGALSNRMDIKFDLQSSRIDSLVAELGHVNLTLGELVGKAHTHDGVA